MELPTQGFSIIRAVANTVVLYFCALSKGAATIRVDGKDALPLVREIYVRTQWLLDREVFEIAESRGAASTPETLEQARIYRATRRLNIYGGPEPEDLEASLEYNNPAAWARHLEYREWLNRTEACIGNLEDRERLCGPSPEFTDTDFALMWHAGFYRRLNDLDPCGRDEGAWVAEHIGGALI